ncbi:hypothetical protein SAMN05421787_11225 [Virgibacillus pantothenticus]|nr:hypothetical protein SAMN05421787_11225 [Virgibacillus pantothenticus]
MQWLNWYHTKLLLECKFQIIETIDTILMKGASR